MYNPLVSFLIPLYNAEQFVQGTILSCLSQSYGNVEVIVVDDHSTDKSLELARKYEKERVHIYQNPKKGGNAARNYAFQMSKGEYVKFLDADDYCSPQMVEHQMERMMRDGTQDSVVFSPVRMYYADKDQWLIPPHSIEKDYTPGIELLVDIWRGKGWRVPHCHLMHRSLVEKAGMWDESVLKNQDGEFFARVYAASDCALSVPDEYAVWVQHESGVHAAKALKAVNSAASTLGMIAKILLDYRDDDEMRYNCNRYLGTFLYENYADVPQMLPHFNHVYQELGLNPFLPQRRILKILQALMGWKLALKVIKKYNL